MDVGDGSAPAPHSITPPGDTDPTSHHAPPDSPTLGDMTTTALRRVPVLMTGTWNASTGTEPITDEDLLAIVEAAESGRLDPAILKKGHLDPRFSNYLEDGEPAFGQVKNPVIEDGILYVDYDPIDAALAERLEVEYPRCSVELARNVELRDAEGNVTAQFDVALTAVALLGATPPAVKGLSVHASALGATHSQHRTILPVAQFSAVQHFSFPGGNTAMSLAEKLSAAVRQAHSGEYSWAFMEDFDDQAVIFSVSTGDAEVTYRQTYNADGALTLTGDPVQVVKETKWVTEAQAAAPAAPAPAPAAAAPAPYVEEYSARHGAQVPPQPTENTHAMSEAAGSTGSDTQSGDDPMPTVDKDKAAELRRKYDLAENSSYEDIVAAILEDKPEVTAPKPVAPGTDELPAKEAQAQRQDEDLERIKSYLSEQTPAAPATPSTPAAPELDTKDLAERLGGQFVSASAFAAFQQEHQSVVARLAAREEAETKARRDALVTEWFSLGQVGPDDAELVRTELDKPGAEETITSIISARPKLYSGERGHAKVTPEFLAADTDATLSQSQYDTDDAVFGLNK